MQLITLALAASASALVAPVAPKASTALKGATLDDQLKKIPGVSPLKNAPADYGFDPLGFAKVSYPRFGLPEDDLLRTNNLRDAEFRHGRLAMLAAAAWPIQELAHPSLAKTAGAPGCSRTAARPRSSTEASSRAPCRRSCWPRPRRSATSTSRPKNTKAERPEDWIPGFKCAVSFKHVIYHQYAIDAEPKIFDVRAGYGFDPLNIVGGMSPLAIKNMQAHSRRSTTAVAGRWSRWSSPTSSRRTRRASP